MNMEEMMKKAQEAAETIQKQMGEAQAKLDTLEVEGVSGGGLVKIRCTAKGRILGVSIDDSLIVPDDKQMLEDLVAAAFNDARAKADQAANARDAVDPAGHGPAAGVQPAGDGVSRARPARAGNGRCHRRNRR